MDLEGNIYDLRGNFIGTTDDDGAETAQPAEPAVLEDDVEYGDY